MSDTKMILLVAMTMVLISFGMLFHYEGVKKENVRAKGLNPIVRLVHKGRTFCSGFVIDKNTIVTAGHCLMVDMGLFSTLDSDPIEIRTVEDRPTGIVGKPYLVMMQIDRGILKGNFSMFDPIKYSGDVKLSVKIRVPGNTYVACGYPLGGGFFCNTVVYIRDEGFCLAVKGVIIPGMSGGPVMLEDGTVVAINDAVGQDYSVVCPIYNVDMEK